MRYQNNIMKYNGNTICSIIPSLIRAQNFKCNSVRARGHVCIWSRVENRPLGVCVRVARVTTTLFRAAYGDGISKRFERRSAVSKPVSCRSPSARCSRIRIKSDTPRSLWTNLHCRAAICTFTRGAHDSSVGDTRDEIARLLVSRPIMRCRIENKPTNVRAADNSRKLKGIRPRRFDALAARK